MNTKTYLSNGKHLCPNGIPHYWVLEGTFQKCRGCGEERVVKQPPIDEWPDVVELECLVERR